MSRAERRKIGKVAKNMFSDMTKLISENIIDYDDFDDFVFTYKDKQYDIEPIIAFISLVMDRECTMQASGIINAVDSMLNTLKESDEISLLTAPFMLGEVVNDAFDDFLDMRFYLNLSRVFNIAKMEGVFDKNKEKYNIFNHITSLGKEPVLLSFNESSFSITEIYNATANLMINTYMMDCDEIIETAFSNFLTVDTYMLAKDDIILKDSYVKFEDIDNFIKFARIVILYYFDSVSDFFPIDTDISGDMFKDVSELGDKYLNMLNSLEFVYSKEFMESEIETLLPNNYFLLAMCFTEYSKYSTLTAVNKLIAGENEITADNLSNTHAAEISKIKKQLNKEIKKLKEELRKKENATNKLIKENTKIKERCKVKSYESKIFELEGKLKAAENKYEKANARVKSLENKLEEQKSNYVELLAKANQKDDFDFGNEVAISIDIADNEDTLSYEDKVTFLKDKTYLVVGGNPNFILRLKEVLPNIKHIDTVNEGCNFTAPASTDCIINVSKYTKHAHVERAKSQVGITVPLVNISTYKIEDIIDILYRELSK